MAEQQQKVAKAEYAGLKWRVTLYGRQIFTSPYRSTAECLAADINTVLKAEADKKVEGGN